MMYRAGIIGCGNIGGKYDESGDDSAYYTHAGMYSALSEVQLASACDLDPERLHAFGDYWNVTSLYQDFHAMLSAEKFDILSIATPDSTHSDILTTAIRQESAKVIFTEKPLAEDTNTANLLLAMAAEKRITIVVDYIRRWDKAHQALHKYLEGEDIGSPVSVTGYYVRGIRHNGCQLINLLHYLFGPIVQVQTLGKHKVGSLHNDPSLTAFLETKAGTPITIHGLDRHEYEFSIFEIHIFCSAGRVTITNGGQKITLEKTIQDEQFSGFRKLTPVPPPWPADSYGSAMGHAGRNLIALIRDQSAPNLSSGEQALQDLYVIEAILASAHKDNKVVQINAIK